jgi:hypothetical protein
MSDPGPAVSATAGPAQLAGRLGIRPSRPWRLGTGGPALIGLLLGLAPVAHAETTIAVDERVPAVALVMSPRGAEPGSRTTELLRAAARALESRTDLGLQSAEQAGSDLRQIDACADRLSCWVRAIRPDFASHLATGGRYADHVAALDARGVRYPRVLLVVSIATRADGADRVGAMLVDTDHALSTYAELREARTPTETIENRVFETAVLAPGAVVRPGDTAALARFFDAAFDGPFRAPLEQAGHWDARGRLRLEAPPGLLVELDGRPVGQTGAAPTVLTGLRAGDRSLGLTDPSGAYEPWSAPAAIGAGQELRVTAELSRAGSALRGVTRGTAWWGGAVLMAAGGALTVWGAAGGSDWRDVSDAEPSPRFTTFCDLLGSAASPCATAGGQVKVAPLGYGLALAGGTWMAGAWLDEGRDGPWLPMLIGVAAGAAAYGLSAALDGGAR